MPKIYISTMAKLPEKCDECVCYHSENGDAWCNADKEKRYSEWRPFWCPLKTVDDKNYLQFAPGVRGSE